MSDLVNRLRGITEEQELSPSDKWAIDEAADLIERQQRELAEARAECERLKVDAERWHYARQFLDETDVVAWGDWDRHEPDEDISKMTDAAIDKARHNNGGGA